MQHPLALLAAAALMTTGISCKKKPASPPAPTEASEAPVNTPVPTTAPAVAAGPSASSPTSATGIAQAKPGASESGSLNAPLTGAVARFKDKHNRLPASWQELVQGGFIQAIPQPPPGKRFAIDPVSHMVVEQ